MVQRLIDSSKITNGWTDPIDVAKTIVNQLYSTYGGQNIIPASLWWASAVRGLPSWIQERLRDVVSKEVMLANA
jgi:hypothetical protein